MWTNRSTAEAVRATARGGRFDRHSFRGEEEVSGAANASKLFKVEVHRGKSTDAEPVAASEPPSSSPDGAPPRPRRSIPTYPCSIRSEVDHDAATAIEFLEELYRGTEDGWLSVVGIDPSGRVDVGWGPVADGGSVKDHINEFAPGRDVYFGVAPRREQLPGNRRGGDADCRSIPALWIDVDIADSRRHRDNGKLPRSRIDAQGLINAFPLRPTAVVNSGGGY
jgi:hypothetical protein